jgi:hypothetical protein
MSITPQNFDPHAEAIDGPERAWSDYETARADFMAHRDEVAEAVARSRTYTVEVPLITSAVPVVVAVSSAWHRPRRWPAWVALGLLVVVAALLALAVAVPS